MRKKSLLFFMTMFFIKTAFPATVADYKQAIKPLLDQIAEIRNSFEPTLNEFKAEKEEKTKGYEKSVKPFKEQFDHEVASMKKEFDENMKALEKKREPIEKEYRETIKPLQEELYEKIEALREEYDQKTVFMKAEYEQKIDPIKQEQRSLWEEYNEKTEPAQEEFNKNVKEMREKHFDQVIQIRKKVQEKIKERNKKVQEVKKKIYDQMVTLEVQKQMIQEFLKKKKELQKQQSDLFNRRMKAMRKLREEKDVLKASDDSDKKDCRSFDKDGKKVYFQPKKAARNYINKWTGEAIPWREIFTDKVFTDKVIDELDENVIKPKFKYSSLSEVLKDEFEELNASIENPDDDA